jgi:GrpB-like predicted nucleotidyltransferase (UPF0157 family)
LTRGDADGAGRWCAQKSSPKPTDRLHVEPLHPAVRDELEVLAHVGDRQPRHALAEQVARELGLRIRGALGPAVVQPEYLGSTSVPGPAVTPTIDILLVVRDPADEPGHVRP